MLKYLVQGCKANCNTWSHQEETLLAERKEKEMEKRNRLVKTKNIRDKMLGSRLSTIDDPTLDKNKQHHHHEKRKRSSSNKIDGNPPITASACNLSKDDLCEYVSVWTNPYWNHKVVNVYMLVVQTIDTDKNNYRPNPEAIHKVTFDEAVENALGAYEDFTELYENTLNLWRNSWLPKTVGRTIVSASNDSVPPSNTS